MRRQHSAGSPGVPYSSRLWLRMALLSSFLGAACDQSAVTTGPALVSPDVRAHVAGEAAENLTAEGKFVLPPPRQEPFPQISAAEAAEQAVVHMRMFGPLVRKYLEEQHGAPLDFARLEADPRVYYATTPYEQTIPPDFHPGLRKNLGPYYLVVLRSSGRPVLSVAVSAYNTDFVVRNGELHFPVNHGNNFMPQGAHVGREFSMPVSPERAVQIVAEATGARVVAVPALSLPQQTYVPQFARWRIALDRPVRVRGVETGQVRDVRELYVGNRGVISVPRTEQPGPVRVRDPEQEGEVRINAREGMPTAFERVQPLTR